MTRLATPRSFLDKQYKCQDDGGPLAYGLEADVSDCFYNYVNPQFGSWFGINVKLTARDWIKLGWERRPIFSDEQQCYFTPSDDITLYPVFEGLCMGWSWALFLANEAVAHAVAGRVERPLAEVRDRFPPPDLSNCSAVTGVYVDNISIVGTSPQAVQQVRDKILNRFQEDGIPLTWSSDEPSPILETVGGVFDSQKGVARNRPKRLWRAFLAG